jgi:hypothetical protein
MKINTHHIFPVNNETEPLTKATRLLTNKRNGLVKGFGHPRGTETNRQAPQGKSVQSINQSPKDSKAFVACGGVSNWLLGIQSPKRLRVWIDSVYAARKSFSTSSVLRSFLRPNPGRNVRLPSLRQSPLHQSRAFVFGNAKR